MATQRRYSIEFKRQVVQEYQAGDTLHGLGKRHGISRNLVRIWAAKAEAGEFDDDLAAASILQEYEARIGALERLVGKLALENEFLKGLCGTFTNRSAPDDLALTHRRLAIGGGSMWMRRSLRGGAKRTIVGNLRRFSITTSPQISVSAVNRSPWLTETAAREHPSRASSRPAVAPRRKRADPRHGRGIHPA
jgi:transposase